MNRESDLETLPKKILKTLESEESNINQLSSNKFDIEETTNK